MTTSCGNSTVNGVVKLARQRNVGFLIFVKNMSTDKMRCGTPLLIMTNNRQNQGVRFPAEWEPQGAVIVAWPHAATDWAYMLSEVETCYIDLIRAIARHATAIVVAPDTSCVKEKLTGIEPGRVVFFDAPTNDTWTRDYGVITTVDADGTPVLNDFGFNAWGGKFDSVLDNGITRRMVDAGMLRGRYNDMNRFILEGGSIESDGKGTLLTTVSCLLTPTRNAAMCGNPSEIERVLAETLGVRKVLWLDRGAMIGDDTDGHIDTIARLAPNDTILYCGPGWGSPTSPQSEQLQGMAEALGNFTNADGHRFNLIELPLPEPVFDSDDGHRLPATYANFLILNDAVLMPTYGQPDNDRRAVMALQVAFPDHIIETVDCRPLVRQHGSLHCATMQVPASVLPF